jgi:riboflavin kinase/FMN adenylyltransferase
MRIIHAPTELGSSQRVCLAIGFFDGVHLGHQQILRQTIADARQHGAIALAVTFDCHPNSVVAPNRVPPLIYPLSKKLRTIDALGLDALLLLHFDRELSALPGEQFFRDLVRDLGRLQSVCVGANFVFGHKRGGNVDLLKRLGSELKFTVHGLAAVALDHKAVSSTRIREAIREGSLDQASQMLGRPYSIFGTVIEGDRVGRQLGFPTANIDVAGLVLPPNGVYAVQARLADQTYQAVLNIGHRPTLKNPDPHLQVECHIMDFSGEIYGRDLEVVLLEKLRDEKKFPSLDALRNQISADVQEARTRF